LFLDWPNVVMMTGFCILSRLHHQKTEVKLILILIQRCSNI
jgi:hypothetical protein